MRRIPRRYLVAGAMACLAVGGGGGKAAAAVSSSPVPATPVVAPPTGLYACVGAERAVLGAYTVEENFVKNGGCGTVGFPITIGRGPAGPAGPGYQTEVNNNAEFAVSGSKAVADTSAAGAGYSDAGVVVDAGQVSGLTAPKIAYEPSGNPDLRENIWIGNGPQASTAGIYPAGSADFCYGLGTSYVSGAPTAFQMQSKCGSMAGKTETLADIRAAYPNIEAYAWVGVTSSGNAVGPVTVSSVGGKAIGGTVGIDANSMVLTPYVR